MAEWMADVADALGYAHGLGVIHRDVKPSNLLLSADGRMMISDFGLARASGVETVTATRALLGTARYMSPEQVDEAAAPIDHRSDVYALGATMYELLAFRPMFAAADDREVLDSVLNREPTPPHRFVRRVPRELETICLKAVEKERTNRYDTAKALADDLRRWLLDLPIHAQRPSLPARAGKFVRRRKVPSALAAVSVVLLITAGLIYVAYAASNRDALAARSVASSQRVALLQAEAAAAFRDRQYHDALAVLDQALLDAPGDLSLRRGRAVVIRFLGREAEAAELLEGICDEAPDDWSAHHQLAMLYRGWEGAPLGKLEEHTRIVNELVPDTAQAYYAQALSEPDDRKAIALLDKASEKDPGLLEIVLHRGGRYAKLGDYESELRDADRAVAMAPKAAFAHADRGHALFNLQRYDESEQAYGRAIKLDPGHALYWHHRSLARSGAGRFDLALSDATRAIELDETLARAYLARARAHCGRGAFVAAREDCDRGIALDPRNFNFYIERSSLFNQLGQFEEMLADCTWVVELAPDDPRGYSNRIAALAALGRLERAIPDAARLVEVRPDDPASHDTQAKLMYRLHRFTQAADCLTKVIALSGGQDAVDFAERGRMRLITGRPDAALADLTRAIELDPSRPVTRVYRAAAYADLDQIDQALADLAAASDTDGALRAYVALWRYLLLAENGRTEEAEETLRTAKQIHADVWTEHLIGFVAGDLSAADLLQAAANDDERAEAHYYFGRQAQLDGRPEEAREELIACVELDRELMETDFARTRLRQLEQPQRKP